MYSLILVDYNSLEKTIEYAKLCLRHMGVEGAGHVVIVENGTPEDPLARMAQEFGTFQDKQVPGLEQTVHYFQSGAQEIYYCDSGSNLGYAKGNNLGAKIADHFWQDEFYIISNNDLVFEQDPDLTLVNQIFAGDPSIGVIGPGVITPAGERQSPRRWQSAFHRLIGNYWTYVLGVFLGSRVSQYMWDHYRNDTIQNANSGICAWVSGCFMFVRAKAFHQAGMFDEHTFLYGEEMILSKRLEAQGYHVFYCGEVNVVHKHAQTTKKAISSFRNTQIDFEANYYFYKTYQHTSPIMLWLARVSFVTFKALITLKHKIIRH